MSAQGEHEVLAALFGGEWLPLPAAASGEDLALAADVVRKAGGTHYVVVQGDREVMVGSAKGKFAAGTRMAGQLLASVVGASDICFLTAIDSPQPNPFRAATLLFLGRHGEDETQRVAVGVLNGVPVFDLVGSTQDLLSAKARDFVGRVTANSGLLLIDAEVEADFAELKHGAPASVRIVDGLPFDADWATKTGALQPVGIARTRVMLLAAAAAFVVAPGAWLAYNKYTLHQADKKFALEQAAKLRSAANSFDQLLRDALAAAPMSQAAPAARLAFDFARRLLDERGGFTIDRLTLTPSETSASFTRTNRAKTFSDFVSSSDEGTPTFDITKLDGAAVAYPALAWGTVPVLDLKKLVSSASVLLDLGSLAQRSELIGVKLSVTAPVTPLNKDQWSRVDAGTLAQLGRLVGTWSATGPVDLLVPLCEALPADACTLSQVEFKWSRDGNGVPTDSFVASGRYIVGTT